MPNISVTKCVRPFCLNYSSYYFPRGRQTPRAASSSSSLLPPGCQPLPDIFTGVVAYLHGYEEGGGRERYLVAYNGDVCSGIDESTTHIICKAGAEASVTMFMSYSHVTLYVPHQEPLVPSSGSRPVVVSEQWVDDCLQRTKLLPTDKYLV